VSAIPVAAARSDTLIGPATLDARQQRQPGRVVEQGEPSGPVPDQLGMVQGGDRLADPLAVDDALICALSGQQAAS